MASMASEDFRKQMAGYGLTTANILYRRPITPGCCRPMCGRPTTFVQLPGTAAIS